MPERTASINPFATRYVAPGRLPWIADGSAGLNLKRLASTFRRDFRLRAAIVGPHGTGKSTLLEHLVPLVSPGPIVRLTSKRHAAATPAKLQEKANTNRTLWFTARASEGPPAVQGFERGDLVVIDGYEQFSWIGRLRILTRTGRIGAGLLITSHRKTALATLTTTRVDGRLLEQICRSAAHQAIKVNGSPEAVAQLLPGQAMNAGELSSLLQKFNGNARDCLMYLYDQKRSEEAEPHSEGPNAQQKRSC